MSVQTCANLQVGQVVWGGDLQTWQDLRYGSQVFEDFNAVHDSTGLIDIGSPEVEHGWSDVRLPLDGQATIQSDKSLQRLQRLLQRLLHKLRQKFQHTCNSTQECSAEKHPAGSNAKSSNDCVMLKTLDRDRQEAQQLSLPGFGFTCI